jgi:hypothetical protein
MALLNIQLRHRGPQTGTAGSIENRHALGPDRADAKRSPAAAQLVVRAGYEAMRSHSGA